MLGTSLFDAISSKADLDDPAEQLLAQRFMVEALGRVAAQLPDVAKDAASVANRFITSVASAAELANERIKLWNAIQGREQSAEPEMLRIRTAICALHSTDMCADLLAYFIVFWERGGLDRNALWAAAENKYGNLAGP